MRQITLHKSFTNVQHLRDLFDGYFQKIVFIRNYEWPDEKIKSPVRLIRAKEMEVMDLSEDYDLSMNLENLVAVDVVHANHINIFEKTETTAILKTWLRESCETS